ncbi:hypothetical protein, partial [Staphylococcus aureus]|uniref:hypothetical protein n=1 Tax=Staphylococcus aureus TaxID=1280 RepID=UPI001C82D4C3
KGSHWAKNSEASQVVNSSFCITVLTQATRSGRFVRHALTRSLRCTGAGMSPLLCQKIMNRSFDNFLFTL